MRRRTFLLAAATPFLRADSAQEVWNLFTSLAAALSGGNATEFLHAFDPAMPGYDDLRRNVSALLNAGQVQNSVELVKQEGDDRGRTVDADWYLAIKQGDDATKSTRREQTVTCRLEKKGKQWRIVALDPVSFFALPGAK